MATHSSLRLSFAGLVLICLAWPAQAQSLADVAKKEEDRRKAKPEPAKVYTNKDLQKSDGVQPPDAAKTADSAKDAAKDGDAAKDKDKAKDGAADKAAKDKPKDQAYWSGRLKALNDKLTRETNYVDAMQTRINALNTDFVNRDDPIQRSAIERDRQKALSELDRLKKDVADDKKAIADLMEEARQAGVPPAWMR
jgi:hypothetical protein